MRILGLLLLTFGMIVLALNWLDVRAEWLGWVRQWGEDGALIIGFGGIVLGFVLGPILEENVRRGFILSDYLTFNSSRPDGNRGISTETAPAGGVATMAADGTFFLYPDANGDVNFKQTTPSRNLGSP